MNGYCLRKGIVPPGGMMGVDQPVYAPMPAPLDFDHRIDDPGYHGSGA